MYIVWQMVQFTNLRFMLKVLAFFLLVFGLGIALASMTWLRLSSEVGLMLENLLSCRRVYGVSIWIHVLTLMLSYVVCVSLVLWSLSCSRSLCQALLLRMKIISWSFDKTGQDFSIEEWFYFWWWPLKVQFSAKIWTLPPNSEDIEFEDNSCSSCPYFVFHIFHIEFTAV